jgi:hypothetical protein
MKKVKLIITASVLILFLPHLIAGSNNPVNTKMANRNNIVFTSDYNMAPRISINDASRTEGKSLGFQVTLDSEGDMQVKVDYKTKNGSAKAPGDYDNRSGTLIFEQGQTSKTIAVATINDDLYEGDETFTIELSNPFNATIADDEGIGTILEDDVPPVINVDDVQFNEGGDNFIFTMSITKASGMEAMARLFSLDGTANAPDDYTPINVDVSIPAGSQTSTINVPINDDEIYESDETFTINISNPTNATIGDGQATITIQDNDPPPSLHVKDVTVNEDAGTATFTVSLSTVSGLEVTYDYSTSDGTANAPDDYTSTDGMLTIPSGSSSGTVDVPIIDDTMDELDETFTMYLSNPTNVAFADSGAVCTIVDNDSGPLITVADVDVNESAGTATFTVSLSVVSNMDIAVDYTTSDGTANAPDDYTSSDGTLTIPSGNTSGIVEVPIVDDTMDELDETFTVDISNPVNATIEDGQITVTIIDNDDNSPPTISDIPNQVTEEDTPIVAIAFVVDDAETAPTLLTLAGSSNNQQLVPNSNIEFGGQGTNRTVTVSPDENQSGSATVRVTVSDGSSMTHDSFDIDVIEVNDAPTISDIPNQVTEADTPIVAIPFVIADAETAPDMLTLTGSSNNQQLVPNDNIAFGGEGTNRTVTVTPANNQTGTATITVEVSDGNLSSSDTFELDVSATPKVNIAESSGSTNVTEGGETDSYDIVLNSYTYADVVITITPDDQLDLGEGGGTPITKTFNSENWSTDQKVPVSAVDDFIIEDAHTGTITHSSTSTNDLYNDISIVEIMVNIIDNDVTQVKTNEHGVNVDKFALEQNYPNPFNPTTLISYQLPKPSEVSLTIYNFKGQLTRTLIQETKQTGYHSILWNGRDNSGNLVSDAVYIYHMKAGEFSATRKLILLK